MSNESNETPWDKYEESKDPASKADKMLDKIKDFMPKAYTPSKETLRLMEIASDKRRIIIIAMNLIRVHPAMSPSDIVMLAAQYLRLTDDLFKVEEADLKLKQNKEDGVMFSSVVIPDDLRI